MKKVMWGMLALIVILTSIILLVPAKKAAVEVKEPAITYPASPKDATYNVEDVGVTLVNGQATVPSAPGSSDEVVTTMFGEPVMGDLDLDGDLDAAVVLQQNSGGTGSFYYISAATNTGSGYKGANALFVGDRIAPQTEEIKNGVLIFNYADRGPNEPFSAKPSFGKSMYAQLVENQLMEIKVSGVGVGLFFGQVTFGGEVRSFLPCGDKDASWVLGNSPAYKNIFDGARAISEKATLPYTPIFAAIIGRIVPAPIDGFGADYKQGFEAVQLVKFIPGGSCK